jgi:hypothetical protein
MLTVTIGTITRTYVVVETTATVAADGVDTLAIQEYAPLTGRYVAVPREAMAWQTARDGSGLWSWTVHDEPAWDEALQRWLGDRLTGQTQAARVEALEQALHTLLVLEGEDPTEPANLNHLHGCLVLARRALGDRAMPFPRGSG